jgi:hypothetical protein
MMSDESDDLGECLRRIGFRARTDAIAAFLEHAHKSRVGPTETVEQLVDLEERARAAVNLARRTRFACLGSFNTMDRFDWSHPEKIDRALVERLLELDFADQGEDVLLKGGSGLSKTIDRAESRARRARRRLHRSILDARCRARRFAQPGIGTRIRATPPPLHEARSLDPRRARTIAFTDRPDSLGISVHFVLE